MNVIKKLFSFTPSGKPERFKLSGSDEAEFDVRKESNIKKEYVSDEYDKNLCYIRKRFNIPLNNDVVLRELALKDNKKAFIVFYDGMVDGEYIDNNIIKSLLELPYIHKV